MSADDIPPGDAERRKPTLSEVLRFRPLTPILEIVSRWVGFHRRASRQGAFLRAGYCDELEDGERAVVLGRPTSNGLVVVTPLAAPADDFLSMRMAEKSRLAVLLASFSRRDFSEWLQLHGWRLIGGAAVRRDSPPAQEVGPPTPLSQRPQTKASHR